MKPGRRAALAEDTTPGKVLTLGLLANAPIAVGFILVPLAAGPSAGLTAVPYVLFGTPLVAAWGFWFYKRATPERRQHRAARIGALLCGTALALWALVGLSVLLRP